MFAACTFHGYLRKVDYCDGSLDLFILTIFMPTWHMTKNTAQYFKKTFLYQAAAYPVKL